MERARRVKWVFVFLVVVGAALGVTAGCSSSGAVAGTYESEAGYLELDRDGTFYLSVGALGGNYGRYEVKGRTLTLRFEDGSAVRATIKGNTITFPRSSVIGFWATEWVRE